METADSFGYHLCKMGWEERRDYMMGLARWKHEGMTYTAIGRLLNYSSTSISKHLKPYEALYRQHLDLNLTKLEQSLKRNDPDYEYLTDPRTVTQQMCALVLGGDEVKRTLEQLINLEQTK